MNGVHHRHGMVLDGCDGADPAAVTSSSKLVPNRPPAAAAAAVSMEDVDEKSPLQRPRPPERVESRGLTRREKDGDPWAKRLSQRASMLLWQPRDPPQSGGPFGPEHFGRKSKQRRKRMLSCGEAACLFVFPAVIVCLVLLALSNLATYFTARQVQRDGGGKGEHVI